MPDPIRPHPMSPIEGFCSFMLEWMNECKEAARGEILSEPNPGEGSLAWHESRDVQTFGLIDVHLAYNFPHAHSTRGPLVQTFHCLAHVILPGGAGVSAQGRHPPGLYAHGPGAGWVAVCRHALFRRGARVCARHARRRIATRLAGPQPALRELSVRPEPGQQISDHGGRPCRGRRPGLLAFPHP